MMAVCTVRNVYMKIELSVIGKAPQHLFKAFDVEVADFICSVFSIIHA